MLFLFRLFVSLFAIVFLCDVLFLVLVVVVCVVIVLVRVAFFLVCGVFCFGLLHVFVCVVYSAIVCVGLSFVLLLFLHVRLFSLFFGMWCYVPWTGCTCMCCSFPCMCCCCPCMYVYLSRVVVCFCMCCIVCCFRFWVVVCFLYAFFRLLVGF